VADPVTDNRIAFKGVAVTLEGTFVWRAGFETSVNTFRVPANLYAGLRATIAEPGSLVFRSGPSGQADLTIAMLHVVDVEPGEVTLDAAGDAVVQDYRIILADRRDKWGIPRGGRVKIPPLPTAPAGGKPPVAKPPITNQEVIEHLLTQMGVNAAAAKVPSGVKNFPPIRGQQWLAGHAPTKLREVADSMGLVLWLQYDGTVRLGFIGEGESLPAMPAGRELPALDLPGIDRRGKVVVLTSAPNAILDTITKKGPTDDGFQFVAEDWTQERIWLPLKKLPGLGDPLKAFKTGLTGVPAAAREQLKAQIYRQIRLNPEKNGRSSILRIVRRLKRDPDTKQVNLQDLGLQVQARIAVKNPATGRWKNSDGLVDVKAVGLIGELVIVVEQLLLKLDVDGETDDPLTHYKELEDGDLKVTFTREVLDPDTQLPKYYNFGLRQDLGGQKILSEEECENALDDPDTVVVRRPDIRLTREDGKEEFRGHFNELAQLLITRFVQGSGDPARVLSCAGYFKGELSGLVAEVRITQTPPRTDFRVNTWWLPRDYYQAERRAAAAKANGEAYPGQMATLPQRTAEGASGAGQPSAPIGFASSPATDAPAQLFPVFVTVDGGVAGGATTDCSWTYKVFSFFDGKPLQQMVSGQLKDVDKRSPAVPRFPKVTYAKPPALSLGIAYRDQEGTIKLYHVAAEFPEINNCPTT
jgi:hypothetical protein